MFNKRLSLIFLLASLTVTLLAGCAQPDPSGTISESPVPPSSSSPAPEPIPATPAEPSPTAPASVPEAVTTPVPTPAPTEISILSVIEGEVFLLKPGTSDWVKVEVGMVLEPNDIVKTGDDSNAEITFFEGSVLELKAGSQIQVISTEVSEAAGSTTILLRQEVGKTISRVNKLTDSASRYEIETPAGTAAVRGSIMIVDVSKRGTTKVTNEEGDIFAVAQGVELKIRKNKTAIIILGKAPELLTEDERDEGDDEEPDNG